MAKDSAEFIITPEFRVAFPYVFEAQAPMKPGDQAFYSITMLFPKDQPDLLVDLKRIAMLAVNEKWPDKAKRPQLRSPFGDGDQKDQWAGYPGHIYVRAKSKYQPGLVDAKRKPIISANEFYGGCYARAQINAYAYSNTGNVGVAFGLSNVQKLRDGEPFGGAMRAEDAFDEVVTDDDAALYGDDVTAGGGADDMFG